MCSKTYLFVKWFPESYKAGLPLELLYADDLILMAESEESLRDKIVKWKSGLEAKGLKTNTGKLKVKFSYHTLAEVQLSHTRRECCKGDDASQWENGKFDPLPGQTP